MKERKTGHRKLAAHLETIKTLAGQGIERCKIAEQIGVSYQTVSVFMKENGITCARANKLNRYSNEILLLHQNGATALKISEMFKVAPATVCKFLTAQGVELKRGLPKNPEVSARHQKIIAYYLENHSLQETGDKFGISRERVRQILNLEGIKPRDYTLKIERFRPTRVLTSRERFWRFADKSGGEDSCWNWQGCIDPKGYGRFSYQSKNRYAHHIAFLFANKRSCKLWVLHNCDNPSCVNPKHLREGTPKENIDDRSTRNREVWLEGIRRGKGILTESQVRDIKQSLGKETNAAIARRHSIPPAMVSNIKHNKIEIYKNFSA